MRYILSILAIFVCSSVCAQVKLMDSKKEAHLKKFLPRTEDSVYQDIFYDKNTIFYTDQEIPQAYQHAAGGNTTFHSVTYNISADYREKAKGHGFGGNAGIEFPWRDAGGTHRVDNIEKFRFVLLAGPIAYYRTRLNMYTLGSTLGYQWVYATGTIFGEVLMVKDNKGNKYTFEVRLRTKTYDGWEVDILRPYPHYQELANKIKELRPKWYENQELSQIVYQLQRFRPIKEQTLTDTLHPNKAFHQKSGIEVLPKIPEQLVKELLLQPFKLASGSWWHRYDDEICFAPTSEQKFNIVPKNYDATFLGNTKESCMNCHDSTTQHVKKFDASRDWYGFVPGSDGIFSFHPIALNSISYNGFPTPVSFRQEFIKAGLLEPYNSRKHPPKEYYNAVR